MKKLLGSIAIGLLLVAALVVAREPQTRRTSAEPVASLRGGAASLDGLVDSFLRALATKDIVALRQLAVTEDEYKRFVIPNNIEPGQPQQGTRPDVADYFWQSLNGKSLIYLGDLVDRLGGQPLTLVRQTHSGEHDYAGFKSFRRLRLEMKDAAGNDLEIATGSAITADGRFKFVSFIRD